MRLDLQVPNILEKLFKEQFGYLPSEINSADGES